MHVRLDDKQRSQISVSQNIGLSLHSPQPENTVLTVTNPTATDSLEGTKATYNESLNVNYQWQNSLMCLHFRRSRSLCKNY